MKNLKLINQNIQKDVTENTVMVEFKIDINNVAPFMCSPYAESWIWSENIKDLNNYIFDLLIPEYLINVLMASGNEIDDKEYSFEEAINMYKNSGYVANKEMEESLNELVEMYNMYDEKESTYIEFIKMIIRLEEVLNILDIDFKAICYANPYEARFSNSLRTDKFDYKNLANNF